MEDSFEYTRFKIFGLLHTRGGAVEDHKEDVAVDTTYNTSQLQPKKGGDAQSDMHSLGTGKKKMEAVMSCMTRVTTEAGDERFILKVHYDEHSTKSVIITTTTTAKAVCAIGATKLKLTRFYYSLFAQRGNELHVLADDQCVADVLTQWKEEGAADAKLLFLRPPPVVNLKMRERILKGWLNFALRRRAIRVNDLRQDLANGLVLVALVEEVTGRKNLPHNEEPASKEDGRANCEAAIELFKSFGICIPGDPAAGIAAGNMPVILGLLWSVLFRHCTVNNCLGFNEEQAWSTSNASEFVFIEGFLGWCNQQMAKDYSALHLNDFGASWSDGLGICALLEMADGYAVSFRKIWSIPEAADRLEYVLNKATEHFRIPALLSIADFLDQEHLDEVSVIAYLVVLATCLIDYKAGKASRSSKVAITGGTGKGAAVRIYFEGLPGVQDKVFMLQPGVVAGELRQIIGQKMRMDPNGFWIYIIGTDSSERVPGEDETVLVGDSTIVIRMVSGSNYYAEVAPASPSGPTRADARKKKKAKRLSFFGGKKKA